LEVEKWKKKRKEERGLGKIMYVEFYRAIA
jgi:hypothetical protein